MRTAWSLGATAVLLSQTVFVLGARAATFPDVQSSNPYSAAISALADMQVIKGNADGTYAPDRTVNRAEFLVMLYRSKSVTPAAPATTCFKDVPSGSWFEAVVCDAAKNSYVSGYADKNFRPEQEVNRVEALKMMFTVLGLNQKASLEAMKKASGFSDVITNAWYMQYLSAAFNLNILPVPGTSTVTFGPDRALSRAEAAGFIYNAIFPTPLPLDGSAVSSQSVQRSSAAQTSSARSVGKDPVTAEEGTISTVDFPFSDEGIFNKKLTRSYRFGLTEKTTLWLQANLVALNTQGNVTCRLYKVEGSDSFSLEYYIGNEGVDTCTVLATLSAGSYQFDIQPKVANANFTVTTKKIKGDGNDGFVEAKNLLINTPVSTQIDITDLGDFYTFKLKEQTNLMIELTNEMNLKCVIYPMADVDIYGFSGPDCNKQYDFPAGTYYIGVLQRDGRTGKQNYSVRYKN